MRYFLTILLLVLAGSAWAQDIKAVELRMRNTVITDLEKMRKKADSIFLLDPYNEVATYYLTTSFKYSKYSDSVGIFFSKQKTIDARSPRPYLLSAKYQFQTISVSDTMRLNELKIATMLDSNNFEAHYFLGTSYYDLFHQKATNYYATRSRAEFLKAIQINGQALTYLKYPVVQLSHFLKDVNKITSLVDKQVEIATDSFNVPQKGAWYYPLASFLDLKDNWENDDSLDLMDEIDMAIFRLDWYSGQLYAMKEPIIFNQKEKTIYRFTWLRSFHKPVAIRLEKVKNSYTLYWKMADGAGGYDPGVLTINKSMRISESQWNSFISGLQLADFWEMPEKSAEMGNDGAKWIIEGMDNGTYHVVDRWSPEDNNFQKCGMYLIKLKDLGINKNEIY